MLAPTYSSFAFALVAIHASLLREHVVTYGFMLLCPLSVLTYARFDDAFRGKALVRWLDRTLAKSLTAYCVVRSAHISWCYGASPPLAVAAIIGAYNVHVFYVAKLSRAHPSRPNWHRWAASIHVVTALGSHACLGMLRYYRGH